jgi:hypothetical protein
MSKIEIDCPITDGTRCGCRSEEGIIDLDQLTPCPMAWSASKTSGRPGRSACSPFDCATLMVAKLDRLARNVAFISALMEAGVTFQAVDLRNANNLTVHMAAMAEYEAKAMSERTKVA